MQDFNEIKKMMIERNLKSRAEEYAKSTDKWEFAYYVEDDAFGSADPSYDDYCKKHFIAFEKYVNCIKYGAAITCHTPFIVNATKCGKLKDL